MKRLITRTLITAALGLTGSIPIATASDTASKAAVCEGCHGAEGRSEVPDNPILAAQHANYLISSMQAYISGERDYGIMKTLAGNLSSEEMPEVAAYFAAQAPHQSGAMAAGDASRGKDKTAVCAACHGAEGRSENPMFPRLAGQHAVYTSKALQAYKSGARSSNIMPLSVIESLSDRDIEDIAAYYAAQPPLASGSDQPSEDNQ